MATYTVKTIDELKRYLRKFAHTNPDMTDGATVEFLYKREYANIILAYDFTDNDFSYVPWNSNNISLIEDFILVDYKDFEITMTDNNNKVNIVVKQNL